MSTTIMMTTAVVSSLVGQEAVSEASKGIFHTIKGIYYHKNPIVKDLLEDIDIYNEIELIKTLIQEINVHTINSDDLSVNYNDVIIDDTYHIINDDDIDNNVLDDVIEPDLYIYDNQPFMSTTLTTCLFQLRYVLTKIYKEINHLNINVERHNKLWFRRFRRASYSKNLRNIKKYKYSLKEKFDNLIKLMNIYSRLDYTLLNKQNINEQHDN